MGWQTKRQPNGGPFFGVQARQGALLNQLEPTSRYRETLICQRIPLGGCSFVHACTANGLVCAVPHTNLSVLCAVIGVLLVREHKSVCESVLLRGHTRVWTHSCDVFRDDLDTLSIKNHEN